MMIHRLFSTLTKGHVARLFALLAIVAIGSLLRFWQIDKLPPGFHFDEAFEGLEAWRILTDPTYRPIFLTGNFGVPPLNSYVNALTFSLWRALALPVGPTAMRVTAAVFGIGGIIALWALARELRHLSGRHLSGRHHSSVGHSSVGTQTLSPLFPLWAATFLATMRWHIHFSRMGIEPIIVPLIWALAMALLLHGWRTGRYIALGGSGVVLAAGMYAYQGAWVSPFLWVATAILLAVSALLQLRKKKLPLSNLYRSSNRSIRGTVLAGLIAGMLVVPLGWFFWQHIDLVFLRPAQLSIVGETTSPADGNVVSSIWATAKMFGPFGMPGDADPRRNVPGMPALNIWYAVPFYLGLGLTLFRVRQFTSFVILSGFVGLLIPGVISEYAPHFHRILGASAPTALLCAVGLDWLWQWRPLPRIKYVIGPSIVVLLLIAGTVRETQNYFVRWAALPDLFHAFDVGLWQIGQQIAAQPAAMPIYLTPRNTDHATLAFAWSTRSDGHAAPISFDGRQIFPLTAGTNEGDEYYIAIEQEDFRTRLLWPGLFAEAPIVSEISDNSGELYARTYYRPAHTPVIREPAIYLHEDRSAEIVGDGIALLGFDVQPARLNAGAILYIQYHWLVDVAPTAQWTVFTHLLQKEKEGVDDGDYVHFAGHDSQPGGGSLPTTRWQAGWQILDEYQISLPPDLQPGTYVLAAGLYQPSGEQLPVTDEGSVNRIILGTIDIE